MHIHVHAQYVVENGSDHQSEVEEKTWAVYTGWPWTKISINGIFIFTEGYKLILTM